MSNYPLGIATGMILGELLDEDDIQPIDFICKKCDHSFSDHESGICKHGIFNKCECNHFILNLEQVQQAKRELVKIEKILLKNLKEAMRLNNS